MNLTDLIHRSFLILHPSSFRWEVAGYGWPGHGANVVHSCGDEGSTPSPSAAPMVKRTIMSRFDRDVPGSNPGRGSMRLEA